MLSQHSPVYTLGKRGSLGDIKLNSEALEDLGVDVARTKRGGEVTFHGPGQLVLYPIVDLRRLRLGARAYVEALEDTVVTVAAQYGISAKVSSFICSAWVLPTLSHVSSLQLSTVQVKPT